jgi:flagellar biosynthesis anti-sigma factor FlgM
MKVSGPLDPSQPNPNSQAAGAAGHARQAHAVSGAGQRPHVTETSGSGGDSATLSTQGRLLQKAATALRDEPEIRQETVEKVKAEIAQGNYQIDLPALASRLGNLLQ